MPRRAGLKRFLGMTRKERKRRARNRTSYFQFSPKQPRCRYCRVLISSVADYSTHLVLVHNVRSDDDF